MTRCLSLSMIALILLAVCGSAQSNSMVGQAADGQGQPRFTKAENGVITDSATGLQWYVNPSPGTTWHQAKAWTENLTVAGGGWRLPTVAELKAIFQKDAGPVNLDPVFQAPAAWAWSGQLNNAWSVWGYAFYNGLEGWHSMNYGNGRMTLAVRSRR
jgi:hypothetical protein